MVAGIRDKEVEQVVVSCKECQQQKPAPPSAPIQPWSWPSEPWTRLHLDYAGPCENRMILVLVDSHSKWIEALPVKSATSAATIKQLRTVFARFGIPKTIVTDNGTC